MSGRTSGIDWSLWVAWTVANTAAWALGLATGMLLTMAVSRLSWINEDRFIPVAILLSVGLTTGLAQWRVMSRHIPRSVRWLWATVTGYLLCLVLLLVSNAAKIFATELWDSAVQLGVFGAIIGASQWWLLRQYYRAAGLWVLANAVGFLSFLWLYRSPAHAPSEFVMVVASLGALAAVLSGLVLAWMVRQPAQMAAA